MISLVAYSSVSEIHFFLKGYEDPLCTLYDLFAVLPNTVLSAKLSIIQNFCIACVS